MRAEIKSVDNGRAVLEVRRASGCSGCASGCGGCPSGGEKTLIVKVRSPEGGKAGDIVEVESRGGLLLGYTALIFLLPLVMGFAGYFAAGHLGAGSVASYLISFALFITSIAVLYPIVNKAASRTENYVIKGFISRGDG